MGIPNLKEVKRLAAIEKNEFTIACKSCKAPLWRVELHGWYGSKKEKPISTRTPFPGIPPYEKFWDKHSQPLELACPKCSESYFDTICSERYPGILVCKPYCPELDL